MLDLPGDPQAAGPVVRPVSPMAASAPLAGRVLAGSAAFVLGATLAWENPSNPAPVVQGAAPSSYRAAPLRAALNPAAPADSSRKFDPPRIPLAPPREGEEGRLGMPVLGLTRSHLVDNFNDHRGTRRHLALDIMAPRGTPVVAADDGEVAKVYRHLLGGLSVYQYDRERKRSYYYAHLQGFAPGLAAGDMLRRGDLVGYVGTTGNASPGAPHLHFAILELGPEAKWWKGTPVNPYPLLE